MKKILIIILVFITPFIHYCEQELYKETYAYFEDKRRYNRERRRKEGWY